MERQIGSGGRGIQFHAGFYHWGGYDEPWDDGPMRPFLEVAREMKLPVFIGLVPSDIIGDNQAVRDGYIEDHRTLMRWMERYSDVSVVNIWLPWNNFVQGDRFSLPESI